MVIEVLYQKFLAVIVAMVTLCVHSAEKIKKDFFMTFFHSTEVYFSN